MMKLFAIDVFTPNDFPEHTYVARAGENLEAKLDRALRTPKVVASISGPSKSGKTVLAEKLIGKDNLIQISGAEVQSGGDLWKRVLAWMDVPSCVASQTTTSSSHKIEFEVGGSVKLTKAPERAITITPKVGPGGYRNAVRYGHGHGCF
jgi:hypothetical protein